MAQRGRWMSRDLVPAELLAIVSNVLVIGAVLLVRWIRLRFGMSRMGGWTTTPAFLFHSTAF